MNASRLRRCHKCGQQKRSDYFSRLPDGSERFYSWCNDCRGDHKGSRVYVVRLSDEIGQRQYAKYPNVYVGRSARAPEDRFFQHKAGIKKGRGYVYRYGEWLMFRLFRNLPTFYSEEDVLEAEREMGRRLEARGYTVWGAY